MKKVKRVVLGEGYPSWDWTYSPKTKHISCLYLMNNGRTFQIPESWRAMDTDNLPKIRLIAEVLS